MTLLKYIPHIDIGNTEYIKWSECERHLNRFYKRIQNSHHELVADIQNFYFPLSCQV